MLLSNSNSSKENLDSLRKQIKNKFNYVVNFVCSEECKHYKDYANNYNKVDKAVIINKNNKDKEDIILIKEYGIELLLYSISDEDKKQYLENYQHFFNEDKNKLILELIETVKTYFESNMNIGDTAKALYVHRNTIGYRINKLREEFMIDITKPYQCMKLYLAIRLNEQPWH